MAKYVFGFGSLVNPATHDYDDLRPARLAGWRRAWVKTAKRETVFLSAKRDPNTQIHGLIARVPDQSWAALDAREYAYSRVDIRDAVTPCPGDVALYQVSDPQADQTKGAIWLSYLDVVIQGYLHQFGARSIQAFFDSTDGWHFPVMDDRANPQYQRACSLNHNERQIVDRALIQHGVRIIPLSPE